MNTKLYIKSFCFFVGIGLFMMSSCALQKSVISQEDLETFNTLIESKQFEVRSDMLYPQGSMALQNVLNSGVLPGGSNGSSISLSGSTNYLKITGDTISSYLPYFGERHMQVDYGGGDSAIEFEGLMSHYQIKQNKDHSYTITFDAKSNYEGFKVYMKLSPYFKSDMSINGNTRSSIRYSGYVKALDTL